ncbi:phosphatase PAP2 family protein [Litchfieldia salsa]|uniref:Undecaprenyl-diphosphatase n=1 Tax=Litchfieldia salsa TaxID=930152 RepID=A0A1H0UUY3_9BACI|nr:phosphatase PAP2 family protein [Litchfieldia salsa]SDP70079.1 undecaprenyl-diphosphatase [Litchfieldia salsa]
MEIKKTENTQGNRLFLFLIPLTVFVVIYTWLFINELKSGEVISVDKVIGELISSISTEFVVTFFSIFTNIGSKWGIITVLILAVLYIWWKYRDYLGMSILIIVAAGGDQLNKYLKGSIGRERPLIDPSIYAEGYSFPSGHAMVGIMFFGFIAYYLIARMKDQKIKRVVGWSMGTIIFLIGISRIVLNAHYPTDVFGGFAIGLIMLIISILVYEEVGKLINKKK